MVTPGKFMNDLPGVFYVIVETHITTKVETSVLSSSSLIKWRCIWIYMQGNKSEGNAGIVKIL